MSLISDVLPIIFPGLPTAMESEGRSIVKTVPAPTNAPVPTLTSGNITQLTAITANSPISGPLINPSEGG